ncbi:MAG TPA: alcohol dehydrogenase catalytic domain-containing protein [Nitrospirota bacterium]|nr:alcohol dehydrogenase catalytic domain-containing protein [Nitrospirota bacterium]
MLQAILQKPKTIAFLDVPVPEPGKGQVLIKVRRLGICGSDIHVYHGTHKYAVFPVVQGHEGSGVVAKVGLGVPQFVPGDAVCLRPQQYCGACYLCRQGRYNLCEDYKVLGVLGGTTGMASEYFLVDAAKLHSLPRAMSFDEGAMVEPTAVAVHAVKLGGNAAGKNILIIGAGPIGNLAAQAAKAMGATGVLIVDINTTRLSLAKDCGIDHYMNTGENGLEEAILQKFGSSRADFILDCAATHKTLEQSIRSARRGTNIVLVGNFYDFVPVELGLVQRRELNLIGDMNYVAEDYEDAIRFMASGQIKAKKLISKHFALKDYTAAYQYIDENSGGSVMKVLINVSD